MKLKIPLLCVFLLLGGMLHQAIAQSLTITGKVKNKTTGEILAGVNVNVEGTTTSALSNVNGDFSIAVKKGATLVFNYVGMAVYKYKVEQSATGIEILLTETPNNLNEVVVVGYGTQKVTKVSGAISSVKSAFIEKLKPVRVEEALQGSVSGVNVIQSGSPGSKPTVYSRGIPSFYGTDPVVIIDGVPQTLTDLNSINATDIESVNVLKDAATTAIYGVKGGNGVIVVTTKSGRKNLKTEVSISSNYGVQDVVNTVGVLNATEYAAIINEGSTTAGGGVIFPNLSALGVGSNWQNEVFKTAALQSHNISVRGGSDKMTYFLAGGYSSQGGIVGGNEKSNFSRGNFTANLTFNISNKVKFLFNNTAVILNSKGIQENSFNSVLGSALNFDPTVSVYNTVPNTVGKYVFSNLLLSEIFNPLTKLDNTYNKNNGFKLYGKFELQYDVTKSLKLTTRFGYTKYDGNAKSFTPLVF